MEPRDGGRDLYMRHEEDVGVLLEKKEVSNGGLRTVAARLV